MDMAKTTNNGDPFNVYDPKPVYGAHEHKADSPRSIWDLPVAEYCWRG